MGTREQELQKYLNPTIWSFALGIVIILMSLALFIFGDVRGTSFLAILLLFALAFLTMREGLKTLLQARKSMDGYRQSGDMEKVLTDFEQGTRFFRDGLRAGDAYLIGARQGAIVPYEQVARLYQYIHKTNFAEDKRLLVAVLTNGKRMSLSKLALRGKDDEELGRALAYILTKNPSIQLKS